MKSNEFIKEVENFPSVKTGTPAQIARKHNVPLQQIKTELAKGTQVELEHTTNRGKAREIALDHLMELPDYYTRLDKMENE